MIDEKMWNEFVDLYLLTNKYLKLSCEDFAKCFVRIRRYEINRMYNLNLKRHLVNELKHAKLYIALGW